MLEACSSLRNLQSRRISNCVCHCVVCRIPNCCCTIQNRQIQPLFVDSSLELISSRRSLRVIFEPNIYYVCPCCYTRLYEPIVYVSTFLHSDYSTIHIAQTRIEVTTHSVENLSSSYITFGALCESVPVLPNQYLFRVNPSIPKHTICDSFVRP